MILTLSKDLERLDISANGNEIPSVMGKDKDEAGNRVYRRDFADRMHVTTIENPVLMTDNVEMAKLDAATRYSVFNLFGRVDRVTEYVSRGGVTSIHFRQVDYPGVWGPSIDTVLMCKALDKMNLNNPKKVIEVGAGSGFISKHLLRTTTLDTIELMDLNPHAKDCWENNIDDERAFFVIGDATKKIEDSEDVDLLVCNPPYIPRPKSIDDNAYEGVGLMVNLIDAFKEYSSEDGILLLNYSNLCADIFQEAIKRNNLKCEIIESMDVPLKVCNVINNPEWMNYLIEKKGLEVRPDNDHPYWQSITIAKITK